jgi:hypothetical protein
MDEMGNAHKSLAEKLNHMDRKIIMRQGLKECLYNIRVFSNSRRLVTFSNTALKGKNIAPCSYIQGRVL